MFHVLGSFCSDDVPKAPSKLHQKSTPEAPNFDECFTKSDQTVVSQPRCFNQNFHAIFERITTRIRDFSVLFLSSQKPFKGGPKNPTLSCFKTVLCFLGLQSRGYETTSKSSRVTVANRCFPKLQKLKHSSTFASRDSKS